MISEKLKKLAAARASLAALESDVTASLRAELADLPARYGFNSPAKFLRALRAASGVKRGQKKRRRRTTITDEMRAEVKRLVEAGKTGAVIAATVGISLPSVQNIKKAYGLVKPKR